MYKVAIFNDVHANLPAFEAVLADIDKWQADTVVCLGDLVDFSPWPNETIDAIRKRRILTILGNHDERIANDHPTLPLSKHFDGRTSGTRLRNRMDEERHHDEKQRISKESPYLSHTQFSYCDEVIQDPHDTCESTFDRRIYV
jgi:predicted phosphodiesterase